MTPDLIRRAIKTHGTKTAAAAALGLPRKTMMGRLDRGTLRDVTALNWKIVLIGLLIAALAGMTNLYLGKRDQYAALEGTVRAFGEAAEKALKEKEDQGKENLAQIRKTHEDKLPEIRAAAVANYLAHRVRVTAPSGGSMPNPGASEPVDDDKVCQPVPDTAFIESAAEDAAKLEAWQDYARLNGIPVTE